MTGRREGRAGGSSKTLGRIVVASLTLGFLATAGAVWWYYTRQLAAMRESMVRELMAVSESKARQVANWRSERLGDGHVQMAAPVVRIAARILAGRGTSADRADLLELMARLQQAFLYTGGALTDLDGNVRADTSGAPAGAPRLRELAREAVLANDVRLSDLRLDARSGRPMMALTIPVDDLGAIVLDIDPERFLYPYLRAWPGHSRTAESLLVRRDGEDALSLSELRRHPGAPLRFRRPVTALHLPADAALEAGQLLRYPDYRGVPVLAIVRRVPDSPWFLIVKIDAAEVDAPEKRLGWEMAIITALIALVNVAGVALVWRNQSSRIHQEREAWFYAVANDTPANLWMATAEEENSFINTPLARFLGIDGNRLGNSWSDNIHPEDAEGVRVHFRECAQTQSEFLHEFRIRRYDGEYRWVVDRAVPRFSPKGVFLGFAGSLLDITGRRLAEEKLREANRSLAAELAESTRKEREIQELSARLIDAQEEERKRLARELHDDFSQQIAALSIATGNLKRQIPEDNAEARAQSDRIHGRLVQLADAVRRMSHELHPAVLQYSGLAPALRSYCEEFSSLTGIQVSLDIQGSLEGVAPAVALCLFRVTQEALRNVARHARVSVASVELRRAGGSLRLTISDTGAGMEPGRAAAKAGLGLLNIRERARLVGGTVEIRSSPGQGTSVTVEAPG
jgi:PAS domain S-box-containing protein